MALKQWKYPTTNPDLTAILQQECNISGFIAELLVCRGVTTFAQANDFLQTDAEMEDPFLLADMQKAVDRITRAIDTHEKIVIYGDYDCDGVTSTTILYTYLSCMGADVSYYIPDREKEGYGLNIKALDHLAEAQNTLLITVDNGISAVEEVAHANTLGIDCIVTDHHQIGQQLPPAYAVVNPHRKDCRSSFKSLCGVGVVFKLITALEHGDYETTFEQFGEIVAIGTVADVVDLVGENRLIVRRGLALLQQTNNIGLSALFVTANIVREKISSHTVAFSIAPRINAAGRMKEATLALQLLLCDDEHQAQMLAEQIESLNALRKNQEQKIIEQIENYLIEHPLALYPRVLSFFGEGWHPGIIGIVSSRMVERFGKPNCIMSLQDGKLKGSARSVTYFHLYQALTHCTSHLIQYGGHAMAAGFLLEEKQLPAFRQALAHYAANFHERMPQDVCQIDKVLTPEDITLENIKALSQLEPFGAGNQTPVFLIRKVNIVQITSVSEDRHCRLKCTFGDTQFTAMRFGVGATQLLYRVGDVVDVICAISINPYNGKEYLSVSIKQMRRSGFDQNKYFSAKAFYEAFRRGEPLPSARGSKIVPTRDDVALLYQYLKKRADCIGDLDEVFCQLSQHFNYHVFRVALDVLAELELVRLSPLLDQVTLLPSAQKVDLATAPTMQKLADQLALGSFN